MINLRGPYRIGAFFALLSAALHILVIMVGGAAPEAITLVAVGLVYLAIGYGLLRGMRWLAFIAFFVFFIGAIFVMANIWTLSAVPSWWFALATAINILAVVGLFAALWRPAPTTA
jgi:hypothetical protein